MIILTEKIITNLDNLDIEFKNSFVEKVLYKIKIEMKKKIEQKKYKDKLEFIENNCEIISEIRNEQLILNHPNVSLPSYCFFTCYDIIEEFKKTKDYPNEINWLYLYRIINIPHYKGYDNINYNPEIFDNGYNEYYNYESEENDGYDSY